MAAEPQNERMDDLLKSVAKKRQDEAGEPFALHPATRNLLQGEVARTYRKAGPQSRWSRLLAFWPRIGFAAATLAILLTVMLAVIPNHERHRELARTIPANTAAPEASADSAGYIARDEAAEKKDSVALKNESTSRSVESLRRIQDTKAAVKELDGATLSLQDRPALPASKPQAPEAKRPESLAKARAERLKSIESNVELRMAEEPAKAGRVAAATQPQDSNAVMLGTAVQFYAISPDAVARTRYSQVPAQTPALAGAAATAGAAQPVLLSFEFEQTGDQVRITDADGSVYQGQILSNALDHIAVSGGSFGRELQQAEAGKKLNEAERTPQPYGAEARYFRATGTNRSLQKQVTIEASLSAPQPQTTSAPPANAPAGRSDLQRQNFRYRGVQTLPQIRGRAQIGTNQQVIIEAVPARK